MEFEANDYRLVYHIHTILENGIDPLAYTDYMVDAHSGVILKKWSTLMRADVRGNGQGKYNGAVTLFTNSNGSSFELKDMTRGTGNTFGANAVTNMNKGTSGNGTVFTDADNAWGDGATYVQSNATTSANGQTVGVDSAYGQQATWDMFKNLFGRNGMDGAGKATYIRVHYANATADAFYSDACYCVALGDAGGGLNDATSIQTVAHELGHSFCSGSSDLVYAAGETGGLCESNSDITAAAAYFYAKRMNATGNALPSSAPQNDACWNLFSEEGPALRYMTKPSKDGTSPNAWSSSLNSVEQHSSSGPNNRMFFFLTSGASSTSTSDYYSSYTPSGFQGIGPDKAYRIWYKAMTNYLTSSSKYAAARTACLNAATDLYGANTPEYYAVMNAYAAINVGTAAPNGVAVSVTPATATVQAGASFQFAASVTGSTNTAVTWTATGGTITASGLFTAPASAGTYTVKATSAADTTKSASATVTVTAPGSVSISITPATATVATGGTQQFAASVTGSTNTSVTWTATAGTVSSTGFYTAPATAGTYTVKATSAADTTKSASATVTVTSGGTGTEKILNGGFESGVTSWTGTTAAIGTFSAQPAYAGTKNAWLCGNGKTSTEYLYQAIAIPSAATSATLSFYVHIDTAETTTSTAYDKLVVSLQKTNGSTLKTLATYSNLNKAAGYVLKTFDVSAYKGQTVRVYFKSTEDSSLQTSFVLDNVSLITK